MAVVALTLYEPTARAGVFTPHRVRGRVESGAAGDIPFEGVAQPSAAYTVTLNGWRRVGRGWYLQWSGVLMRVSGVVPGLRARVTTIFADESDDVLRVTEQVDVGGEPVTIGGEPVTVERSVSNA